MLVFDDFEETTITYKKIIEMDLEDRISWEDSMNFKSLGRINDEFYRSIEFEKFNSADEIVQFVTDNSTKIQIVENDGEQTIETVLYNHHYRYLANKNGLFQINDKIYLVLNHALVSTCKNKSYLLNDINESNYMEFEDMEDISIHTIQATDVSSNSKDQTYNCGTYHSEEDVDDKEKLYMRISIESTNFDFGTYQYCAYIVRPYHKVFGVWYLCKRKMNVDISVAVDHYKYSDPSTASWYRKGHRYICNGREATSISGILADEMLSHDFFVTPIGHFGGYDCTVKAYNKKNTSILLTINVEENAFLCP